MWEVTEPHAICGFAVTRETAEALLMVQPTGTFLVRLSSQPGALAIRYRSGMICPDNSLPCLSDSVLNLQPDAVECPRGHDEECGVES